MSDDDVTRADVINRLMCGDLLSFAEVERSHPMRFREYFAAELEALKPMEADGIVELGPAHMRVLPPGWYLRRSITMVFDAYLPQSKRGKPLFLKSI